MVKNRKTVPAALKVFIEARNEIATVTIVCPRKTYLERQSGTQEIPNPIDLDKDIRSQSYCTFDTFPLHALPS